jgi:hypothetical protein
MVRDGSMALATAKIIYLGAGLEQLTGRLFQLSATLATT